MVVLEIVKIRNFSQFLTVVKLSNYDAPNIVDLLYLDALRVTAVSSPLTHQGSLSIRSRDNVGQFSRRSGSACAARERLRLPVTTACNVTYEKQISGPNDIDCAVAAESAHVIITQQT